MKRKSSGNKRRSSQKPSSTRRKVKRVIDGDTFELHRPLQGTKRVRIANMNAPEVGRPGSKIATDKLRRKIEGKHVTIKPVAKDKYGRIVADVIKNRKKIKD